MVFKEIILIKVTLRISKNLRKGDNNEEKISWNYHGCLLVRNLHGSY